MIYSDYGYEIKCRDHLLCVYLYGEIDHHSAADLRRDLDDLILQKQPLRLVLDLSRIEFMDSAGLGLLMGRYRLMQSIGGVLVISNANQRVLKILRLSGMERFFEIVGAKGERI